MGGDSWAPCLLLGQWGLHDEALPTATATPRAGILLGEGEQWVRVQGKGEGRLPTRMRQGLPQDS